MWFSIGSQTHKKCRFDKILQLHIIEIHINFLKPLWKNCQNSFRNTFFTYKKICKISWMHKRFHLDWPKSEQRKVYQWRNRKFQPSWIWGVKTLEWILWPNSEWRPITFVLSLSIVQFMHHTSLSVNNLASCSLKTLFSQNFPKWNWK